MFATPHVVLTYHEHCPNFGNDESDLRTAFAANWRSRGWNPIELHRPDADAHPLAPSLRDLTAQLPTINWPDFEAASWIRYAALATWFDQNPHESHALFCDYDLFNRKFLVADVLPHAESSGIIFLTTIHEDMAAGACFLNRHAASILPRLILEIAPRQETWFTHHDGRRHTSDMTLAIWLHKWSRLAHSLPAQQPFDPILLHDSRPAMAMRASAAPIIHLGNELTRFHPSGPIPRANAFIALNSFFP